jgi:hypothetical protein
LSVEFKILLSTIILTLVSLIGGNVFDSTELAYGQFFETNSSDSTTNSTESDDSNAADIVLLSQKLKKADIIGYRHLVGQVKNIGNDTGTSIRVDLTTYDKNGDVLGTDYTYVTADSLEPNQKSAFNLGSSGDNFKGMKSYELSLQWSNPDGSQGYKENVQIYKANNTADSNN